MSTLYPWSSVLFVTLSQDHNSFHGYINASVYKELHQHALLHLRKGTVETPIFVQDNESCHKAKIVLDFLEGISVMKWPPQSLDIIPQENLGKIRGGEAQSRNPQNIDDLWGFLNEEWDNFTTTFCNKLVGSCDWRSNEIIQCEGKFTKYWIFL